MGVTYGQSRFWEGLVNEAGQEKEKGMIEAKVMAREEAVQEKGQSKGEGLRDG